MKTLCDGRKIQVQRVRSDSGEVWEVHFIGKRSGTSSPRLHDFVHMKLSILDLDLARVGIYAKDWIMRAMLPGGPRPDGEE